VDRRDSVFAGAGGGGSVTFTGAVRRLPASRECTFRRDSAT